MTARWRESTEPVSQSTDVVRILDSQSAPLTRAQVLVAMRDDAAFRAFLVELLVRSRFEAFFWEMPPTTIALQERPYEHVLVDAPPLTRITASSTDFRARFAASPSSEILSFPNLGGDAILVVPTPRGPDACYGHLAAFVRGAPAAQIDALFAKLARAIEVRLSSAPLWTSTAGLGVSWLHLRLDSRPKYYRHEPYKRLP